MSTGGSVGSGGATSLGGSGGSGTGGSSAGGGTNGTGGKPGSGGASGSGGVSSSGGAVGSGGTIGTGGAATGGTPGTGGSRATGGTTGTGGSPATGGTVGSGGKAGTGGTAGAGGSTGTGGTSGTGAGGAASACPGTLKAGNSTQTITSSGASRSFIVHIPTGYTGSTPLSVIFDFHPLGGSGSSQQSASHWDTKCDSVGCIAVFPNSATNGGNGWNVGYCCQGAQQNKVDDVQFTRDMIKWLAANTCVDPKRMYASGCSNGGGMSYMLACNAADVIAAVAPVDFRCITGTEPATASSLTATNNTTCACKLPRPISVLAFDEGQDNSIVPFNGGTTAVAADCPPGGTCKAFIFPGAQVNVDTWANFDACTGSATTDPSNSICKVYTSCGGSTQVGLCTAPSGSHCGSYASSKIVDTSWTMFQKASLP
jgi:poly(3-hydroxybutyrate) depolymerase